MPDAFTEDDNQDVPVKEFVPAPHNPSTKIEELPQGKADCFWCGKVKLKSEMREERKYGVKVYVCKGC